MFGKTNMTKTDCFGYDKMTERCMILKETVCHCDTCSFYKTQEQYRQDRERYMTTEEEYKLRRKGM